MLPPKGRQGERTTKGGKPSRDGPSPASSVAAPAHGVPRRGTMRWCNDSQQGQGRRSRTTSTRLSRRGVRLRQPGQLVAGKKTVESLVSSPF